MRCFLGKKGIESYVAWVILVALAVATGVFMYTWTTTSVEDSMTFIEQADDKGICQDVGITIVNVCQNAQTLNMNVSNIRLQGISGLKFQFFDIYDNAESRIKNTTIRPKDIKELEIIKQGTLKQVEITPITIKDDKIIACTKSTITIENIRIC